MDIFIQRNKKNAYTKICAQMFIVIESIITTNWKHPKCPLTGRQIIKPECIHSMGQCSVTKMKTPSLCIAIGMNQGITAMKRLCPTCHLLYDSIHIIPLTWQNYCSREQVTDNLPGVGEVGEEMGEMAQKDGPGNPSGRGRAMS
jgi:hypothetical protein